MFNVGDRVVIAESSEYYGEETIINDNPKDMAGTVDEIYNGFRDPSTGKHFTVMVEWDNGTKNSYDVEDLNHVN